MKLLHQSDLLERKVQIRRVCNNYYIYYVRDLRLVSTLH